MADGYAVAPIPGSASGSPLVVNVPDLPGQSDNSTGVPETPSGTHASVSPQAEFITTGPGWQPEHPAGAGTNISTSSE
jgi:hypothetical protein